MINGIIIKYEATKGMNIFLNLIERKPTLPFLSTEFWAKYPEIIKKIGIRTLCKLQAKISKNSFE